MLTNAIYTVTRTDIKGSIIIACTYDSNNIRELLCGKLTYEIHNESDIKYKEVWKNLITNETITSPADDEEDYAFAWDVFEDEIKNCIGSNIEDAQVTFVPIDEDKKDDIIVLRVDKTFIEDAEEASRRWHFGPDQEFPNSQWANIMGIIQDNTGKALYYAVGTDNKGNWSRCKVFSSMDFDEDSFLVAYNWNDKNDKMLIDALDKASKKGDDIDYQSVLSSIRFED